MSGDSKLVGAFPAPVTVTLQVDAIDGLQVVTAVSRWAAIVLSARGALLTPARGTREEIAYAVKHLAHTRKTFGELLLREELLTEDTLVELLAAIRSGGE